MSDGGSGPPPPPVHPQPRRRLRRRFVALVLFVAVFGAPVAALIAVVVTPGAAVDVFALLGLAFVGVVFAFGVLLIMVLVKVLWVTRHVAENLAGLPLSGQQRREGRRMRTVRPVEPGDGGTGEGASGSAEAERRGHADADPAGDADDAAAGGGVPLLGFPLDAVVVDPPLPPVGILPVRLLHVVPPEAELRAQQRHLGDSGFTAAGVWTATSLPSMTVEAWIHGDGRVVALCRDQVRDQGRRWCEVWSLGVDGEWIQSTNQAEAAHRRQGPPWVFAALAGVPLGALLIADERLRAGRALAPVEAAGVAGRWAGLHRRTVCWRAFSGPDREEIRAVMGCRRDSPGDDAVVERWFARERAWGIDIVRREVRADLLRVAGLEDAGAPIVVIARMTGAEVAGELPAIPAWVAPGPVPREAFACREWYNARAGAGRRLRVAARVEVPVAAELWVVET